MQSDLKEIAHMTRAAAPPLQRQTQSPTSSKIIEIRVKGRWIPVPALIVDGNDLIARGKWLRVAVVRSEDMMEAELENPRLYIEKLRGDGKSLLKADLFTFTQKVPASQPKYSYPMERESVAGIRLASFKEWWEGLPQETRKNVRRAAKRGVVLAVKDQLDEELVQGIREVNDDSPVRQGMPNGYYGKTCEETKKLYGEFDGRCTFICAYFENRLIGFLHLIYRRDVASILNLTTKPSQFDKRSANALVAKAVELCESKGISYITYGLHRYGNKNDDPLRVFKIRNGFEEVLMPRYFVPVTAWGRLCVTAKLHRGLVGILPNWIIKIGLRARARWVEFRSQPV